MCLLSTREMKRWTKTTNKEFLHQFWEQTKWLPCDRKGNLGNYLVPADAKLGGTGRFTLLISSFYQYSNLLLRNCAKSLILSFFEIFSKWLPSDRFQYRTSTLLSYVYIHSVAYTDDLLPLQSGWISIIF